MSTCDLVLDTSSPEAIDLLADATLVHDSDELQWFVDRDGRQWMGDFASGVLCRKSLPR